MYSPEEYYEFYRMGNFPPPPPEPPPPPPDQAPTKPSDQGNQKRKHTVINRIFGHWITTLFGVLTAVGSLSVNGTSLKQWLIAAATLALGALAKDK